MVIVPIVAPGLPGWAGLWVVVATRRPSVLVAAVIRGIRAVAGSHHLGGSGGFQEEGQDDLVDEVDEPVAGLDVGSDQLGAGVGCVPVADLEDPVAVAPGGGVVEVEHLDASPAEEPVEPDLSHRDVVLQNKRQQGGVDRQRVTDFIGEVVECVVGGCKEGEERIRLFVQVGVGADQLAERACVVIGTDDVA